MITTAFVKIWGHRVGAIAWDSQTGSGSFEFDPAFVNLNLNLSPLKMPVGKSQQRIFSFPELRQSQTFKGLPGLLADVLPDKYGNALINAWLLQHNRSANSLNPVEVLCFIGERGMGALEFEPIIQKTPGRSSSLEISSLVEVSEQILSGRKDFSAKLDAPDEKALFDILKIGTSAGGARAKALIAFNPKTKEVRSGQADAPKGFSHWIIKFDGVSDRQFGASSGYGRVEMAYYLMAKDAGITMTDCELLKENGRAHFMTRRFDRLENNEKVHMQSFCAMQHFDFNDITLYSYEQLFETMRALRLTYPEAEQMYTRMVFNVMARNCDDHTKNFAFIMEKDGTWKLSPAFDVCHAYRPGSDWVSQHSLSINGKRKDITKEDLIIVAKKMNVKKAETIISKISAVLHQWNSYTLKVNMDQQLSEAIQKTFITF